MVWGLGAMAAEQRVMERFQRIGYQIMNRSGGGVLDQNPFAATLSDREKRPPVAALLGQAFVVRCSRSGPRGRPSRRPRRPRW